MPCFVQASLVAQQKQLLKPAANTHTCAAGNLQIPQEALYKKNVLITRGRFRPFTLLHNDMLIGAASQFFCDPDGTGVLSSQDFVGESGDAYTECVYRDDTLVLLELTTRDMMEACVLHFLLNCFLCKLMSSSYCKRPVDVMCWQGGAWVEGNYMSLICSPAAEVHSMRSCAAQPFLDS